MSVNFYGFSASGNRDVAAGLGNIQKVRDGERLSGRANASADFDELDEVEDDGVDDGDIFGEDLPDYLKA